MERNASSMEKRHDPLTLIAVRLSAAALIVSLATAGVCLTARLDVDAPATPVRNVTVSKAAPKTVKGTPSGQKAVGWTLQDGGVIEGDDYNNVHYKPTKCEVKGNTATLTVEATNNDADNRMASLTSSEAYQDGVQIPSAYASGDNDDATIQPGVTVELTRSFTLSDPTKPITVEMDHMGQNMDQKISATFAPKN